MLSGKERRRETNVRFGILGTGVVGKTIAARLDAMGHGDVAAHVVAAVWCATEARLQLQDRPLISEDLRYATSSYSCKPCFPEVEPSGFELHLPIPDWRRCQPRPSLKTRARGYACGSAADCALKPTKT